MHERSQSTHTVEIELIMLWMLHAAAKEITHLNEARGLHVDL